jgi:hypothetical protein
MRHALRAARRFHQERRLHQRVVMQVRLGRRMRVGRIRDVLADMRVLFRDGEFFFFLTLPFKLSCCR